jgi:hypothetical protein
MKSFIRDVDSVSEFQEKYAQMNLLLRRLEFDIPDEEAAYRFILEREVSPYSISAILYNITSTLGHRQSILMKKCRLYIECLSVPKGYTTEILEIHDAPSMTSGYNRAMRQSDARYKIYLHQDVFILSRNFLNNLMTIFHSCQNTGMVGTAELLLSGVMWRKSSYAGGVYIPSDTLYQEEIFDENGKLMKAEAIDGFLTATCEDIPWREDLFDGFDFYDISQSFEFRRYGYDIAVPDQEYAWRVHDDGKIPNLFHYNHYREIFLENYKGDMAAVKRESENLY